VIISALYVTGLHQSPCCAASATSETRWLTCMVAAAVGGLRCSFRGRCAPAACRDHAVQYTRSLWSRPNQLSLLTCSA